MPPEFHLEVAARAETAAPLRHSLLAFLEALRVSEPVRLDVVTAVGEAVANAVEHAYCGRPPGSIRVRAYLESGSTLAVEVTDDGTFIHRRQRPGRGFGLRIVRSISKAMRLSTDCGTTVRMRFDL